MNVVTTSSTDRVAAVIGVLAAIGEAFVELVDAEHEDFVDAVRIACAADSRLAARVVGLAALVAEGRIPLDVAALGERAAEARENRGQA